MLSLQEGVFGVTELAAFNTGLGVITTWTPIADIAGHERTSALRPDLEQISGETSAQLLRALRVKDLRRSCEVPVILEEMLSKRHGNRNVARVAPKSDQDAPNSATVMAGIKGS